MRIASISKTETNVRIQVLWEFSRAQHASRSTTTPCSCHGNCLNMVRFDERFTSTLWFESGTLRALAVTVSENSEDWGVENTPTKRWEPRAIVIREDIHDTRPLVQRPIIVGPPSKCFPCTFRDSSESRLVVPTVQAVSRVASRVWGGHR